MFNLLSKGMTGKRVLNDTGALVLGILILLCGNVFPSENPVTIIENTESVIRFKAAFPNPDINSVTQGERSGSQVTVPGYPDFVLAGKYRLPYYPLMLNMEGTGATVTIEKVETQTLSVTGLLSYNGDVALGAEKPVQEKPVVFTPRQTVELRQLGSYSGNPLWSANIYPYIYHPENHQLEYVTELVARIDLPSSKGGTLKTAAEKKELDDLGVTAQSIRKPTTAVRLSKPSAEPIEKWKVLVNQDGLYHVTGEMLRDAGIDLGAVNIKNLRLTANGRNTAIYVQGWKDDQFDADDYFEFWGEANRYHRSKDDTHDIYTDPFTSTNVYWLSWDGEKGLWMGEEDAQVSMSGNAQYVSPISFMDTVHVESDSYYERFNSIAYDQERDHWFYDSGIRSGQKREYEFTLWDPDPNLQSNQTLQCRTFMSGRTMSDTLPHSAKLYINSSYLYDYSWWGQNLVDMQLPDGNELSGLDLKNGVNVLSILNTNNLQDFDYILFNWMNLVYPRLYRAHEGLLKFSLPADFSYNTFLFRIDGFTNQHIDIYKIGYNKMLGVKVEKYEDDDENTLYKASFQDVVSSADTRYVAVTPEAKLSPLDIVQDEPTQLTAPQVSADYVLISHPRFMDLPELDELLELRQSQGLQTLKVDVTDIYDEFNYGKPSDQAIKDFLTYAWQNWTEHPLKYVLFVGDGCYVRYSSEADTLDLVPVHMRQTHDFGAAASDYWYALLDGDDEISDIMVGRIPARQPEQVANAVRKIIDFETSTLTGDWRNRVLYIGGNDIVFRRQGLSLSAESPLNYDTNLLFTFRDQSMNPDPFFGGTLDLLDYFNQGCSFMTFHGHGGGAIWADNGLLRIEDAEQIYSQGRLPFIFSMTCFTGSFESPSQESLADALLFTENEGVVAMLGASGYGWTYNDYYLEAELVSYLYEHPDQTIGEIIRAGKIHYYYKYFDELQSLTEINQYHLLGDPATRLKLPNQVVPVTPSTRIVQQGQILSFSAELPFTSGSGRFDLVDSLRKRVDYRNFVFNNGTISSQFTIGPELTSQSASVRMYATNSLGTEQVNGGFKITLSDILFDSTQVTLSAQDSACFYLQVHTLDEIDNIISICNRDTVKMQSIGNDWYKSERCTKINSLSGNLYYRFVVNTNSGKSYSSTTYSYSMGEKPDLLPDYTSPALTGSSQVFFTCRVFNYGGMDASRVPVMLSCQLDSNWTVAGYDTIDVAAMTYTEVKIPVSLPPGEFICKIQIDPDKLYKETNTANNVFTFNLSVGLFNFIPGSGINLGTTVPDTLHWDDQFSLYAPKDMFNHTQVVSIEKQEEFEIYEQPDFNPVDSLAAYQIDFVGLVDQNPVPALVSFDLPDSVISYIDSLGLDVDIYRYSPVVKKWMRMYGSRQGGHLSATLSESGRVTVLTTGDTQTPTVQVSIDGQPYARDKYISPEPRFAFIMQDANGLDVKSIEVILNGVAQEQQDLAIPDTVMNANQVVAKLTPDLETGSHTMQIKCRDCNGNLYTSEEMTFKTSGEFSIRMLGNYPNPFKEETLFAYMFTIPVEQVTLKIYTASGRMIRDLDPFQFSEDPNPLSADYHEVLWDGLDMNGNVIANGVYFYKLSVTANGETKKITGKMAKLY